MAVWQWRGGWKEGMGRRDRKRRTGIQKCIFSSAHLLSFPSIILSCAVARRQNSTCHACLLFLHDERAWYTYLGMTGKEEELGRQGGRGRRAGQVGRQARPLFHHGRKGKGEEGRGRAGQAWKEEGMCTGRKEQGQEDGGTTFQHGTGQAWWPVKNGRGWHEEHGMLPV